MRRWPLGRSLLDDDEQCIKSAVSVVNASEEMEMDKAKQCVDTSSIDSVDGKFVRQVTLPRAEDEQPSKLAADATLHAKRSLFGTATQQQEQPSNIFGPSRYDDEIPDTKRVKRCLDYELEPVLSCEDNSCPLNSRASTPTSLDQTQDVEYSQSSTVSEPPASAVEVFALQVEYGRGGGHFFVRLEDDFSIGRYESNDLSILSQYVSSHEHCVIRQMTRDGEPTVVIHAVARKCWIAGRNGRWNEVEKGTSAVLSVDQRFRLVLSPKGGTAAPDIASTVTFQLKKLPASLAPKKRFSLVPLPKVVSPSASDIEGEFECRHIELSLPTTLTARPGSASFDCQYKILLEKIRDHGHEQNNKKGPSRTLGSLFVLEIDLTDASNDNEGLGKFLLPMTTLRSLHDLRSTTVETMFYLRGEAFIHFLQQHKCRFWDNQADENNFIGYSYGLLTNFSTRKWRIPNQSTQIKGDCQAYQRRMQSKHGLRAHEAWRANSSRSLHRKYPVFSQQ